MKVDSLFKNFDGASELIVEYGVTKNPDPKSYQVFEEWVSRHDHGPLNYLADHRKELRSSIKKIFPEFRSGIVFLFDYSQITSWLENFFTTQKSNGLKIASYVLGFEGMDYHFVVGKFLEQFAIHLENHFNIQSKKSVDIHPVLERDLAYRAGLGWFGKNSMLINRKHGSFFIIGSLLLDKVIEGDVQLEGDHCGNCSACVSACPTLAIDENTRTIKADQCISTFTIEAFKPETMRPPKGLDQSRGEIFGCDICQIVCPWNGKKLNQSDELHSLHPQQYEIIDFFLKRPISEVVSEIELMSNKAYQKKFKHTPLARTGRIGMLKNLKQFLDE